jgi:ABC-2 type transport system ATP-binding protein
MLTIKVNSLSKYFRVYKNYDGALGSIRGLFSRQYSLIKAVDDISFSINKGELVGYIGPNGAGKSTTIKMLTGLLVPSKGEILINNQIPWKERKTYVSNIGAVFGQRTTLWWDLPVIDSIKLLKHIYKIPSTIFQENFAEFSHLLELNTFIDTPVRSLSLGQRMRADICAALLHNPEIVFLDEPTIGLDVVAKERIRQFILHMNRDRKTTILLTTHDLMDVEKLCNRVMIIDHGKLLYDGKLKKLREKYGGKRKLIVEFAEEYKNPMVDGAEISDHEDLRVTYSFDRSVVSASTLIQRISKRFRVHDLAVREPDIENTIRRIYEERLLE